MTDRQALRSMLIYAREEAEDQKLELTAYILQLAVSSLLPGGLALDELDLPAATGDADTRCEHRGERLQ